jgi:hypothetical protein
MGIHTLRNASRPGGSHRRVPSAGIARMRALRGILVLALVLAAGLGVAVLALPGHGGVARPAHLTARQHAGHRAPSTGVTVLTSKAVPRPFMY